MHLALTIVDIQDLWFYVNFCENDNTQKSCKNDNTQKMLQMIIVYGQNTQKVEGQIKTLLMNQIILLHSVLLWLK